MSGLVAFTGPPDRMLLDRMIGALRHRGDQIAGLIETEYGSIAVCEWSKSDRLGAAQTQTSIDEQTDMRLAVSGFTFDPLPKEISIEKLAQLRGSYATAWLKNQRLTIARDAVGTQSLFYGRLQDRWLVASEPKAITHEKGFVRNIRPAAIAQYLSFSFIPTSGTMLGNLWEVEAGHAVDLRSGTEPVTVRYFFFEADEYDPNCDPIKNENERDEYWIQRTRQTIEQAVAERIPVGCQPSIFLSGGLDSSIIAAELARQTSGPIKTFSIHFGSQYPNELSFARLVADRIGSDHEEVLIQPKDFLPRLRKMVWHLDEPIGDPITQPNFELAAYVRQHCSSVFNGEGGDPLFGGPKNLPMLLMHWYGVPRGQNFRERAYLASYRRAYDEWSQLLTEDFLRLIDPERDLEQLLTPFFAAATPRGFLNKLMAINIRLKGAHLILPKVDRMLAASGLTPLSPLFDDRLTKLSFQMPPKMKLRQGVEKWVLKRAYEDWLPREVIERPKSGMRVPVHYWFQKELKRYAASIFSRRKVQRIGMFKPDRIKQLLRYDAEETSGRFGIRLWMLLTMETWRKIVFDREPV